MALPYAEMPKYLQHVRQLTSLMYEEFLKIKKKTKKRKWKRGKIYELKKK